jgi:hypothetical protein
MAMVMKVEVMFLKVVMVVVPVIYLVIIKAL